MHTAIVSLLKTVVLCVEPTYKNSHVKTFLSDSSLPTQGTQSDSLFVPIFPRHRILGPANQSAPVGLESIADVTRLVPPIEIEDEDVNRHSVHMAVVDGWRALRSLFCLSLFHIFFIETYASIPSPATPTSSQLDHEDQFDELFMFSSPNTDPTPVQLLLNAKMGQSSCCGSLMTLTLHFSHAHAGGCLISFVFR